MKVLLINGSPHKNGGTVENLKTVEESLNKNGITTEWFHLGTKPVRGCIDCRQCAKTHRCAFNDDVCNAIIEAILGADGVIIGTPVYFASANGALTAILDRVFYAASSHGNLFKGKVAACIASMYRSGGNSAIDRINKYFAFSEMPIWSSKDMEKKELLFNQAVSLDFADFYYISLSPSCPELKYSLNQLEKMGYDKYFGQTYLAITNGKIVIKNPDDIKESSNPIHYSCEIKK